MLTVSQAEGRACTGCGASGHARKLAEENLAAALPRRWRRVQGVAWIATPDRMNVG